MARVPIVKREQVPEQFREAFDALTAESGGSHRLRPRVDYHQQPGDGPPPQPFDQLPTV